jgi:predicted nucleic acid-binding protein
VKVVCNSFPLIALARIKRLDLIEKVYTKIHLPAAVWQEVVVDGKGLPGAETIAQALWIHREFVQMRRSFAL